MRAGFLALILALVLGATPLAAHADDVPFSQGAAQLSDTLVTVTVVSPLVLQAGAGFDDEMGERSLVYGETLASTLLLNQIVKRTVRRPRPYTHSDDPRIQAWAAEQSDRDQSFFSGHSSMAFAAAVSGSLMYRNPDTTARAAVWGFEITLATATANLRVRAGRHYYSDVITGALIGTGLGVLLPSLQDKSLAPSAAEWGAIGGGLVVGAVLSEIMPFKRNILEQIAPTVVPGGAGVTMVGTF